MEWNRVIYKPSTNSSTWKVHHFQGKKKWGGGAPVVSNRGEREEGGMLLRHVSLICSPAANKNDDLQRILFFPLSFHFTGFASSGANLTAGVTLNKCNFYSLMNTTKRMERPALGLIWLHPTRGLTWADCFHLYGACVICFHSSIVEFDQKCDPFMQRSHT